MRYFFSGFLLFCIWTAFARYYYVCEIKQHCGSATSTSSQEAPKSDLRLMDGGVALLSGYEQFSFASNSAELHLSKNNEAFLDSVLLYLLHDPGKALQIHGSYRPSERDVTTRAYSNLGLARAEAIRHYLAERGLATEHVHIKHGLSKNEQLPAPLQFSIINQAVQ